MNEEILRSTGKPVERAFLVGVELTDEPSLLTTADSLEELALLAETAGLDVVGETGQKRAKPDPATFIGSGKLDEVKSLAEELLAEVIIFDNELSPRHLREISKLLGKNLRVIDRTALILDIFAQHAHTHEGRLQVELAQHEYRLPRLSHAWGHLERQAGGASARSGSAGGVGLRGPGETQLEVDKREIRKRISVLKKQIQKISDHRDRYRSRRRRSRIPVVAIVGYTNAGKSTLLNALANAEIYTADQLFATLDPTTRRVRLPGGRYCLFTDTVGFIQKLPTQLIAAFRSTLEEITQADLLIHLIDISHYNAFEQFESVKQTLGELEADHIPVLNVFNKSDTLDDPQQTRQLLSETDPNAFLISAKTGAGIEALKAGIMEALYEKMIEVDLFLPYREGGLIALFHNEGFVSDVRNETAGVRMIGSVPGRYYVQFRPFLTQTTDNSKRIPEANSCQEYENLDDRNAGYDEFDDEYDDDEDDYETFDH